MSLGNVSYTRTNEAYFRQALRYLRSTARIPGYELPTHLQRYVTPFPSILFLEKGFFDKVFLATLTTMAAFFLNIGRLRPTNVSGRSC